MRDIARPLRRRAALLAWLLGFSIAGLATAQTKSPRPAPAPRPAPTVRGRLVGDGSDIEPQAIQTIAGGKPAKFDRFVGVVNDLTQVPVATCVSVRLQPRAERLHPTLSSSITPRNTATGCSSGEIRTCGPGETGDCGKYTVTINSQLATPPATYRSDLIGTCAICRITEADVGGVRFAVAKARVDVSVVPGTETMTAQPGGRATYSVFVQRTSYAGSITVTTEADDPANVFVDAEPRTIPPSADPNARHEVLVTALTGPSSPAKPYRIRVGTTLAQGVAADQNSVTLTLIVSAPARPALAVSIDPNSLAARRSTCAQFPVTVQYNNFPANFNGMATLTLLTASPPLPPDIAPRQFAPAATVPITGSVGQVMRTLQIGVPLAAAPNTYKLTVQASLTVNNQVVSDTEDAGLQVEASPPRIKISPSVSMTPVLPPFGSFPFQVTLDRGRVPGCPVTPPEDVELATGPFDDFTIGFNGPGITDTAQAMVIVAPQPKGGKYAASIGSVPTGDYEIEPKIVTVNIAPPPLPPPTGSSLTVAPTSLSFSATAGGPNPAARALAIGSTGGILTWTASDNAPWLTVSPATGPTGSNANAIVSVAGLAAGTYSATITVTSPGISSVSIPVTLTLTAPPPPAASLVVSPATLSFTAPQGGPAPAPQVLSIASSGAPLNWTVTDSASFVNETPATGTTPGASNVSVNVGGLAAGSYSATITVGAPGVPARTVPVSLTVTAVGPGTPVVNGFNPVSGAPGTQVEVIGANFVGVTQVQFNTTAAAFQPSDTGRLFATVPPGATTGPIRVSNAGGTGASFTPFTVTAGGAPSIAGFSPPSGAPGDRITIQGANFRDPSQVFFNGRVSPFVLFGGANFLSAQVPVGATNGPIRVDTSGGSATSAQSFVVSGAPPPPPSASLIVSPASLSFSAPQGGPAPQPQVLSIGSTGATLTWTVSDNATFVDESPASGTTPGATNVSVNVGGLAPGAYNAMITVSAAGASPVVVPASLTITAVGGGTPVVNGFNPVSGGPGTQVEVIGANFIGVTQVLFNTAPASFQPSDSGRLFATVPPGATTGPIRVTNTSGTGASFTPFTVTSGNAPSIASFSPGSGRPGDRITIQGANFTDPAQVFFNGTPSPFVLFAGANFLSAEVPFGATTGPIRVSTAAGSATSAQSFVATP